MKFLILNGPNLNMTGIRAPGVYGSESLETINREIASYCAARGVDCDFFQSNGEGEIITEIQSVPGRYDGCVLNAGAYTHYSYAIRDAIEAVHGYVPFVEVHMSDIHAREPFRHVSVLTEVCVEQICGYGKKSYLMGVDKLLSLQKEGI